MTGNINVDLIMDSGISNVFINAVTAIVSIMNLMLITAFDINTKGLKFRLVVCLILFLFFLNSAECQPKYEETKLIFRFQLRIMLY
ncbi:hypothetical protein Avbf_12397 [Armadillidium vulgare]|nr:hypothetical protein Avbf_12397 [Armadillidium vulgare]